LVPLHLVISSESNGTERSNSLRENDRLLIEESGKMVLRLGITPSAKNDAILKQDCSWRVTVRGWHVITVFEANFGGDGEGVI